MMSSKKDERDTGLRTLTCGMCGLPFFIKKVIYTFQGVFLRFSPPHLCESVLVHVRQAEETQPLDVQEEERDRGPILAWSRVAGAPAQSESCSAQRLHRTTERPLKLPPLSKPHHVYWALGTDHVGREGKRPSSRTFPVNMKGPKASIQQPSPSPCVESSRVTPAIQLPQGTWAPRRRKRWETGVASGR